MARLVFFLALLLLVGCDSSDSKETPTMKLSLSTGAEFTNPSDDQIRDALGALSVERDGEGFAILGPLESEMTYVQVSGDPTLGFDLEYQEGSVSEHYRAAREDYSLDEIVAVLIAFRDGEVVWSEVGDFSKITW
jgi:hypothetical protein